MKTWPSPNRSAGRSASRPAVLPTLSREQINDAARAQLSLDGLTRWLIRQSLSYRFTLLENAAIARAVERQIQREGLIGQPPFLNPLRGTGG